MIKNVPIILYHGTNTIVRNPEVRIAGYNKDFGFGFYCTRFEHQARRWAISKKSPHVVSDTSDTFLYRSVAWDFEI